MSAEMYGRVQGRKSDRVASREIQQNLAARRGVTGPDRKRFADQAD